MWNEAAFAYQYSWLWPILSLVAALIELGLVLEWSRQMKSGADVNTSRLFGRLAIVAVLWAMLVIMALNPQPSPLSALLAAASGILGTVNATLFFLLCCRPQLARR